MKVEPLAIGVCSWSLQVKSIPELKKLLGGLGIDVVQIACGDPHHASWDEGDAMPEAAKKAGFRMVGAMLGFPGEDYTTPETIKRASDALQAALSQPEVVEYGKQYGLEVKPSTAAQLAQMLKADADQWRGLIKQTGFTAES